MPLVFDMPIRSFTTKKMPERAIFAFSLWCLFDMPPKVGSISCDVSSFNMPAGGRSQAG